MTVTLEVHAFDVRGGRSSTVMNGVRPEDAAGVAAAWLAGHRGDLNLTPRNGGDGPATYRYADITEIRIYR